LFIANNYDKNSRILQDLKPRIDTNAELTADKRGNFPLFRKEGRGRFSFLFYILRQKSILHYFSYSNNNVTWIFTKK